MAFLHRRGAQHGESGLTTSHDVLVITEDRQALGSQRPGGHVEDRAGELTGDLVHVRDHEEQALGGREGGAQGAALQSAVHGAGGATLGLHLHDGGDVAPDVLPSGGGPLIGGLGHRGGRGDGVDRAQLVAAIGDRGGGGVAVGNGADAGVGASCHGQSSFSVLGVDGELHRS